MELSENETHVNFDYAKNEVRFFTTRRGERNAVVKRVGMDNIIEEEENHNNGDVSWKMRISLDNARLAATVFKVINK